MNEILNAINERRTVRDFKPDQISDEDMMTILEAGHRAPSAWNRQPWYFTVVQKKSLLDRIVETARTALHEYSPDWVETMPWLVAPSFHYFYNAPSVIFISGQSNVENASGDCAIALMNMVYAAHSLGIQSCVVITALAAFSTEAGPRYLEDMEIPEGFEPMYALSLGYTSKPLPSAAPRKDVFVNYIK